MTRSLLSRLLSCVLLLVVGLAVPGAGLRHGLAHHAAAHEHEDQRASNVVADHGVIISPAGHEGDHPHPAVGHAIATRLDVPLFLEGEAQVRIVLAWRRVSHSSFPVAAAEPRADPSLDAPLRSRPPPRG